jgi:uroporphyrin-III C-methyltransferase / precorrin-2 dehydrogenase / sirohydrochlorin ferrochelatase
MAGKVFLVGAGPGDPELLTVKALKTLQSADAVLHDDLISAEILALAPKTAHIRSVGKRCGRKSIQQDEINALMIAFASFGLRVVRLKSGDPLLFGRAGEEIDALRSANVDYEIIPGVTSAFASAAAVNASLTHRNKASAVIFVTGHHAPTGSNPEWQTYVRSGATLAIYMPGSHYENVASRLIAAGVHEDSPCVVVSKASTPDEQVHRTTICDLAAAPHLPAPALLLVGEVFRTSEVGVGAHERVTDLPLNQFGISMPPSNLEVFTDNHVFWGD